jgi:dienelactone hydrolase
MKKAAWALSCGLITFATAGVAGLGSASSQPPSPRFSYSVRPPDERAQTYDRVLVAGRRDNSLTLTPAVNSAASKRHAGTRSLRHPFVVGLRVVRLVDRSRTIRLPNGNTEPRILVTLVRYPARSNPSGTDLRSAPAARTQGPFPLIVFGHGYTVTPAPYARLLHAWASAGYVVAAPIFPLENRDAPGGPNEADLIHQPGDVRFVISQLLAANRSAANPLHGMIDPLHIAVAGHSDGGDTALAAAYDPRFRDRRIRAAVILSGAEIPGLAGFTFPRGSPPLLATQGTADTINPPSLTYAFYNIAPRPKFLLTLMGSKHLPPYSYQQPQLGIVERVTIAFLDHYFRRGPLRRLIADGDVSRVAHLASNP